MYKTMLKKRLERFILIIIITFSQSVFVIIEMKVSFLLFRKLRKEPNISLVIVSMVNTKALLSMIIMVITKKTPKLNCTVDVFGMFINIK